MSKLDTLSVEGSLTILGACEHPENVLIQIDSEGEYEFFEGKSALSEAPPWMKEAVARHGHMMVIHEPNGVVSNGLDIMLNRLFGVGGPPDEILSLIVAKSSTPVSPTDTSILGGTTAPVFSGPSQNALSKTMDAPAPAPAVNNKITGGINIVETDVDSGASATFWPINRIGLVNVAPSTNLGLFDVIGNEPGQSDPYSRTFSVDFSGGGEFTLNPAISITGVRQSSDFPVL